MTDVVINKRILGLRPGSVVPYTAALEGHVKAGNATVLPAETEGDRAQPGPEQFDARPVSLALAPEPAEDETPALEDEDTDTDEDYD